MAFNWNLCFSILQYYYSILQYSHFKSDFIDIKRSEMSFSSLFHNFILIEKFFFKYTLLLLYLYRCLYYDTLVWETQHYVNVVYFLVNILIQYILKPL